MQLVSFSSARDLLQTQQLLKYGFDTAVHFAGLGLELKVFSAELSLQCFDTVGSAIGRVSGL